MKKHQARKLVLALTLSFTLGVGSALAEEDGLNADPFLAPATPPPPTDTPAPSLGAPTENGEVTKSDLPSPTPPGTEAQIPPATALPEKMPETTNTPLPAATPSAAAVDNSQHPYDDYLERERDRESTESEYRSRALFAHEGGAWQVGIDYTRNGFAGYDFGPGSAQKEYSTQGGVLSLYYYPLRSLTYGRLGIGATAGAYWTKFEDTYSDENGIRRTETNQVRSFSAYGGRLTYEFDYWIGQWLVPHVFYGFEQVNASGYKLAPVGQATVLDYPQRSFNTQEVGGGLHINLNRLEPSTASRALVSTGVRKYYLTYTALQRSGGSSGSGLTHFLGLRFEL